MNGLDLKESSYLCITCGTLNRVVSVSFADGQKVLCSKCRTVLGDLPSDCDHRPDQVEVFLRTG